VTAAEAYQLTTRGGATDLGRLIDACEQFGPYGLIRGLAAYCLVEPVYALDADLVVVAENPPKPAGHLREIGFRIEEHPDSINAQPAQNDLRIQFATGQGYQPFPGRSIVADVLGRRVRAAGLVDVAKSKL
jgi:hypothetical protein